MVLNGANESSQDASNAAFIQSILAPEIIALFIVSCLCLVATVFVQVTFWKHNRNTKILLCHSISLMICYSLLTCRNFFIQRDSGLVLCYFFYLPIYYTEWTASIWISVLSYDVWQRFSRMEPQMYIIGLDWQCPEWRCHQSRHLFLYYSLVAWALPLFFVGSMVIVDHDLRLQEALNLPPEIGTICTNRSNKFIWIFTIGPMTILSAFNLFYFTLTVITIRGIHCKSENITKLDRSKQMFLVYCRLFIIMCIALPGSAILYGINYQPILWIGYACAGSQGIFVFIAHFCKRTTFDLLKKRFCNATRTQTHKLTAFAAHTSVNPRQ